MTDDNEDSLDVRNVRQPPLHNLLQIFDLLQSSERRPARGFPYSAAVVKDDMIRPAVQDIEEMAQDPKKPAPSLASKSIG